MPRDMDGAGPPGRGDGGHCSADKEPGSGALATGRVDGEPWRDPAPRRAPTLEQAWGVCAHTCVFVFVSCTGQSSLAQEGKPVGSREQKGGLCTGGGSSWTPRSGELQERAERPSVAPHPSLSTHRVLRSLTHPTPPVPPPPGGHVVSGLPHGRGLPFPGQHDSGAHEGPPGTRLFTCMMILQRCLSLEAPWAREPTSPQYRAETLETSGAPAQPLLTGPKFLRSATRWDCGGSQEAPTPPPGPRLVICSIVSPPGTVRMDSHPAGCPRR